MSIIQQLRDSLKPRGELDVVALGFPNGSAYFPLEFIQRVIDELDKKSNSVAAGLVEFSELEKLATNLLISSTGLRKASTE